MSCFRIILKHAKLMFDMPQISFYILISYFDNQISEEH